jgi:hypothetical protein
MIPQFDPLKFGPLFGSDEARIGSLWQDMGIVGFETETLFPNTAFSTQIGQSMM